MNTSFSAGILRLWTPKSFPMSVRLCVPNGLVVAQYAHHIHKPNPNPHSHSHFCHDMPAVHRAYVYSIEHNPFLLFAQMATNSLFARIHVKTTKTIDIIR